MTVDTDASDPEVRRATPTPSASSRASGSQEHLDTPGLVVVESDEDVLLYETGHIPGAVKIDWHTDLNDPVVRDYVDGEGFAELLGRKGISRDTPSSSTATRTTGGPRTRCGCSRSSATRTCACSTAAATSGSPRAARSRRRLPRRDPTEYPVVERDDPAIRAFKEDVLAHLGNPLVDVRSPEEYSGERTTAPAYPEEGALRAGHIPTAQSVPWAQAVARTAPSPRAELDAHLPRRCRAADGDDDHRLLPDRRALEPHLVRPHPPAGLRGRAQLRRVVDRVGQRRARADRRRAPSRASCPRADAGAHDRGRMVTDDRTALPESLAEIRDEFLELDERDRLQLLLEFSDELPELPGAYADHPDLLERVAECQSPVFIFVEVDATGIVSHARDGARRGADDARVRVDPGAGPRRADRRRGARVPDDFPQTSGSPRPSARCASVACRGCSGAPSAGAEKRARDRAMHRPRGRPAHPRRAVDLDADGTDARLRELLPPRRRARACAST